MLSLAHKLGQLYGHFHIEQNEEDSSTIKTDSLQIRLHLQRSDFCKLAFEAQSWTYFDANFCSSFYLSQQVE